LHTTLDVTLNVLNQDSTTASSMKYVILNTHLSQQTS